MKDTDAQRILEMLDEVIRNRRGTTLLPGGVPTNVAVIWMQEIRRVGDAEAATKAVAALFTELPFDRVPTPLDFREAVRKIRNEARFALPSTTQDNGMFKREIPRWVRGWLVARAAGDMRVWPEQKEGYDAIQRENPSFRTHVWPEQEEITDDDRARYEERGATMSADQFGALLAALTG